MDVVNRYDMWTPEEDELLAKTVLEYIETGKTQLEAFEHVGRVIGRTPAAVGFRWNNTIRHKNKEKVLEAKKKRRELKKKVGNFHGVKDTVSESAVTEHHVVSPVVTYSNTDIITISKNGEKLFRIKDGYIELSSSKIKVTGFINIDISDDGSITIS